MLAAKAMSHNDRSVAIPRPVGVYIFREYVAQALRKNPCHYCCEMVSERQQLDINSLFDQVAAAASEFVVYFN